MSRLQVSAPRTGAISFPTPQIEGSSVHCSVNTQVSGLGGRLGIRLLGTLTRTHARIQHMSACGTVQPANLLELCRIQAKTPRPLAVLVLVACGRCSVPGVWGNDFLSIAQDSQPTLLAGREPNQHF